jgi:hypothetical protein
MGLLGDIPLDKDAHALRPPILVRTPAPPAAADYVEVVTAIAHRYSPRIMAVLEEIRTVLVAAEPTWTAEGPFEMFDDEFRWELGVRLPAEAQSVGLTIDLCEAPGYGDDQSCGGYGMSFGLDIVAEGGRILGGLRPFNYTNQCWVDARNEAAVAERWSLLEKADIGGIRGLITSAIPFDGPSPPARTRRRAAARGTARRGL